MNTRGQLTIGGHHGNILRCIVYFSSITCICSCNLAITNREKVMLQSLQQLPWKQSLKNQVSKKHLVFFADLLTLKVNIKSSKAI